jgi:hypothetical protein
MPEKAVELLLELIDRQAIPALGRSLADASRSLEI